MRKLFLVAAPIALFAFACSSSDGEDTTPSATDGGTTPQPTTDGGPTPGKDGGGGEDDASAPVDACKDPIKGVAAPKLLLDPTGFVDSAAWVPAAKAVVFSNYFGKLLAKTPIDSGAGALFSPAAGMLTLLPVGNAVSADGKTLYTAGVAIDARGGLLATTGLDKTPATAPVATTGLEMFSPNDIAVHANGTLYVTDPAFQNAGMAPPNVTGVYRVAPNKAVTAVEQFATNFERPNGIGLSPDQKLLYVSLTDVKKIRRYSVDGAGAATNGTDWATLEGNAPDGLAVDKGGNVWVTTAKGIEVFRPDASKAGTLAVPSDAAKNGLPTAVDFGGDNGKTLIVTTAGDAGGGIWTTTVPCGAK